MTRPVDSRPSRPASSGNPATPALPGEERVLVAGDPEGEFEDDRSVNGVPVENSQYDEMRQRAVELGVAVFV